MDNITMQSADDNQPATRGDIREYLKGFATKDDLKGFATKEDITSIRVDLKADLVREIAVASARTELRIDTLTQSLEASNEKFRSQITTFADKFLAQVEGVVNGEKILDHRVSNLEKWATGIDAGQKG